MLKSPKREVLELRYTWKVIMLPQIEALLFCGYVLQVLNGLKESIL